MPLPASSRLQLTPDLDICRILNGMWQVSGAHGPIDPRRAIGEMFSDHGRRVYHPGPRRPLDGERPEWFGRAQPPLYVTSRACAISFARTGRTASAGTVTTEAVSPAKVTNSIS
jgi:hypothetical protein